jgi:hypothetical protein
MVGSRVPLSLVCRGVWRVVRGFCLVTLSAIAACWKCFVTPCRLHCSMRSMSSSGMPDRIVPRTTPSRACTAAARSCVPCLSLPSSSNGAMCLRPLMSTAPYARSCAAALAACASCSSLLRHTACVAMFLAYMVRVSSIHCHHRAAPTCIGTAVPLAHPPFRSQSPSVS